MSSNSRIGHQLTHSCHLGATCHETWMPHGKKDIARSVAVGKQCLPDVPFMRTLKCLSRLVKAQVRTSMGQPCDGLGSKSKCWAGFDSWFDMLMSHIGVN
jgi:hypothetical protein